MSMAELPELEILRRDLDKDVVGKKIKTVEAPSAATIKRAGTKKSLISRLEGAKIDSVSRKGTWILLGLDTGEVLMIGLGDRAQLQRNQNKDAVAKGTGVVLTFTQHGQLRLVDPAKSSELFVVTAEEVDDIVGPLGLDLVDEPVSWTKFGEMVLRRGGKLKGILMDPTMLVGIGPMYSDEILFEAGLRYDRLADKLSTQEIRRLYRVGRDRSRCRQARWCDGRRRRVPHLVRRARRLRPHDQRLRPRRRDEPVPCGPIVKAKFGSGFTYYCEQTQV